MQQYMSHDFPTLVLVLQKRALKIRTLIEAANALLSCWPDDDGEEYVIAVKACLDAITGLAPAAEARSALVKAAEEVGIRVFSLVSSSNTMLLSEKTAA